MVGSEGISTYGVFSREISAIDTFTWLAFSANHDFRHDSCDPNDYSHSLDYLYNRPSVRIQIQVNTKHSTLKPTTTPHPPNMEAYNTKDYDVGGGGAPNEARPFVCLAPRCDSRFKRLTDLDRHYKSIHISDEDKTKFYCDYGKCTRNTHPFLLLATLRSHLRDCHKEDLPKRGIYSTAEWLGERQVQRTWWRCSSCLIRVQIERDGFECPFCGQRCGSDRQSLREVEKPVELCEEQEWETAATSVSDVAGDSGSE
ncbi:hypothetical protein GE09DRAFT_1098704 [Coniochaeta sp. 2T2.1]|nr:hypothetical protein GE09DRAFT_1098704 [Coniochaeta sp. 2T2.1]